MADILKFTDTTNIDESIEEKKSKILSEMGGPSSYNKTNFLNKALYM